MNYELFSADIYAAGVIAGAYKTTPRAYMRSFGCQQNVNDGEKIRGVLAGAGFDITDTPEDADLIIFNTCAVREHAENRVFGNIGKLKGLKEKNHSLIIAVCGCMVQQQAMVDKIKNSYTFVDLVFGPNAIDTLPSLIAQKITSRKRVICPPSERTDIVEEIPIRRDSKFKAWIPIMYGCDNFCSYCIVPYVRGRERSRKPEDILSEFKALVSEGYKEITLLGQNVNSYGKGLDKSIDFSDLLLMLDEIPGDYVVRFMTSHPKDAGKKLIDTIANSRHIAHNLHLPVQSGSDRILKLMNRKYNRANYLELINYAKEKIPDVTFSSDIIVGFPGETQEDFNDTLSLIDEVGYMQLFTFIYSKRTGTKAALMPDDTPQKVKAGRIEAIKKQQEERVNLMLQKLIGTRQRVLVEGKGRIDGCSLGRMVNNLVIEFPNEDKKAVEGQFCFVTLEQARNSVLIGKIAD